jgi:hypothetical protein
MAMIFPGMDPYLEDPRFWSGVHNRLIVYIADTLGPQISPRYVAAVEERVYVEGPGREVIPDVSVRQVRPERPFATAATLEADAPVIVLVPSEPVRETYVAILDLQASERVVTVIEVISPSNKLAGPGRESYLAKQREILSSDVHLVEIDLLRQGPHVLVVPEVRARQRCGGYDYLTCVNRAGRRGAYELYPSRLRDRLPRVRIPLSDGDPDVSLDVQAVIGQAYDAGGYHNRIDYTRPCSPSLSPDDREWAQALIRQADLGGG